MLGRQRAPGRIVDERLPLPGVQRGHLVGLPGAEVAEGGAQGLLLERPHGVPVDPIEPVELASAVGEGVDLGARRLGEAVGAGQVAQVDVDGVEKATRGRQVGRGLHRRDGLGGVQRVDEDEVRVVLAGGPLAEGAEVAEVADALAAGSPNLVQLRQQPGPRLLLHDGGQLQSLGHGDEHGPLASFGQRSGLDLRDDLVPAQGQVARDLEGGLAHHRAVDVVRLDDVLELLQVTAVPPSSSTWTATALPCGTCTRRRRGSPSRWTTVGGSVRRHGAVRTRSRAACTAASSATSSPIAVSTERSAASGT